MALTRVQSEFTYSSGSGNQLYYFTVVVDNASLVSVRNVQSPFGLITDSNTPLPQSVLDDMQTAITQAEDLVGLTSAINGSVTFTAEATQSVVFATPTTGTGYRVYLDIPEFLDYKIISKATTGFDIELSATFTGTLGFDVFI